MTDWIIAARTVRGAELLDEIDAFLGESAAALRKAAAETD